MSHSHIDEDSYSSDSDDETLMLVNLLVLNIEARRHLQRRSRLPRRVIHRDHFRGENLIHHHYFAENPVYPPHVFRRRYPLLVIRIRFDICILFTTIVCSYIRFRMSRLQSTSPYNLRLHLGYGPGPFNSPSLVSIKAVLDPAKRSKDYMYFVADLKTGKVYYAKDAAGHAANIQKVAKHNESSN